jgi:hypothetical protein
MDTGGVGLHQKGRKPTSAIGIGRAGEEGTPATVREEGKEKSGKWMTVIPLDLLAS